MALLCLAVQKHRLPVVSSLLIQPQSSEKTELSLETPKMISGYDTEKLIFIASLDTLLAFETSTNEDSNIPGRREIQKPVAYSVVCLAVFQASKSFWKELISVGQLTGIVFTSFPAVAQREP